MFENHFFLIINQKVEYPGIYSYCIFSKNSIVHFEDILLIFNIWKYLCQTHFYNLLASFREQQQKTFVVLSGLWPLRGCGGGDLNESIKNEKLVIKM